MVVWFEPLAQWLLPQQTFWLCILVLDTAGDDINILLMSHSRLGLLMFVCGWAAVYVSQTLSTFLFLFRKCLCQPFNFCSKLSLKIQSAQALLDSLFVSLCLCHLNSWKLITGLHSLLIDHTVCENWGSQCDFCQCFWLNTIRTQIRSLFKRNNPHYLQKLLKFDP